MAKIRNNDLYGQCISLFTILLLYISQNTLYTFLPDGFIFHVIPAFYVGLLLWFVNINSRWSEFSANNTPMLLLLVMVILAVFNMRTGREIDFLMFLNSLVLPVLLVMALNKPSFYYDVKLRISIKSIVNTFLVVNCVWAIIERILTRNVIPFNHGAELWSDAASLFRSSALWGHGLANSLITTTIVTFILFDSSQPVKKRFIKYALGMVAILCFNSRFFVMWGFAILLVFVFYTYLFDRSLSNSVKVRMFLPSLILGVLGIISIFVWNIAGRLTGMGIMDDQGSTEARLRIFDIFDFYSVNDFLLGIPSAKVQAVYYQAGLHIINENAWIIFLMRFGLIFEILIFVLYVLMFRQVFLRYSKFAAIFLPISFLVCISIFNSIAANDGYIAVFALLACVYQPIPKTLKGSKRIKYIVSHE